MRVAHNVDTLLRLERHQAILRLAFNARIISSMDFSSLVRTVLYRLNSVNHQLLVKPL